MPIKYAEITISRNLEEETWLSYFKNLLGEENIITKSDTIILSFDDGTINDTKSELVDKQFEFGFGIKSHRSVYPIYFKKNDKKLLFLQDPSFKDGCMYMDFNPIFEDSAKYATLKRVPSTYNTIYYSISMNQQLFAIVKIGNNHRYLLAYDDDYFDKSDINYFINAIFTDTFPYDNKKV